jgi:hemolysin activation/secretion protein
MTANQKTHLHPITFLGLCAFAVPVLAQQAPDIGQTLRQLQPAPTAPSASSPGVVREVARSLPSIVEPGGQRFRVNGFDFEGNTQFDKERLQGLVRQFLEDTRPLSQTPADVGLATEMDLFELMLLTRQVTAAYKAAGYPFAQALVPAQRVVDGRVRIVIVEGKYGQVQATSSEDGWKAEAQPWLAQLVTGRVIRGDELERAALLLSDLPGVNAAVFVEPGKEEGTANIQAQLDRKNKHDGEATLTNHGSRYSGEMQARVQANLNSPFRMGDRLSVSALHTDAKMWQMGLNYSVPITPNGLRGMLGYSETHYDLVKDFAGNSGNAKISSVGLSYPWLRSTAANVYFSASYLDKRLFNSRSNGASTETYSVASTPLALSFDRRDTVFGLNGLSYGTVTWTNGDLSKEDSIRRGSFTKLNLDATRIQNLTGALSLVGRVATQRANKNLDSSEGMGLGGAYGVRAYPTGESFGDEGWLTQVELRYATGPFLPYAFYDHGKIKINARPDQISSPSSDQERAGAGFGLRYAQQQWKFDMTLAWRTKGGSPTATQGHDPKPRAFLFASYKF